MRRFGIDVSSFQGSINWTLVARKVGFVFLRSWMGDIGKPDPTFNASRIKAVRKRGIPFGPYCFAGNGSRTGKQEAHLFVEHAIRAGWGKKGDLPGTIDIESGRTGRRGVKFVRECAGEYKRLTGHRPIIYTGSFWRDALANPVTLTRCRLWLSAYTSTWHGWVPKAWKTPSLWQFSDEVRVPGISGGVDGDRWLRSNRAFQRMRLKHDLRP